ncbi:MAG: hypothetical protein AAF580_15940, partial [Pseudomonadota bacterium]
MRALSPSQVAQRRTVDGVPRLARVADTRCATLLATARRWAIGCFRQGVTRSSVPTIAVAAMRCRNAAVALAIGDRVRQGGVMSLAATT